MQFISFDFETTGLKSQSSHIIELAFIKFKDSVVVDKLVNLVKPPELLPEKIVKLTNITDLMLFPAPTFDQVAKSVSDFIGNDILVAYQANFDKSFLNVNFYRQKIHKHYNPYICALKLTQDVFKLNYMPNLKQAIHLFQFELPKNTEFHRAEFDAYYTGLILDAVIKRKNWSLEQLLQFCQPLKVDKIKS